MKKILSYFCFLVILSCAKEGLPELNNSDTWEPIVGFNTTNESSVQVRYELSVNHTRVNASVYVPGSYSHDPQANNHPGYGFNPAGWVNLEYKEKNKTFKTYIWGVGMIERTILGGTNLTISATPAEGFQFHEWSNGVTENPITFILSSDTELTAVFKTLSD